MFQNLKKNESNDVFERKDNWKKGWLRERLLKGGVQVHFIKLSKETALEEGNRDGENFMSNYS